jgi:hypothetical protein
MATVTFKIVQDGKTFVGPDGVDKSEWVPAYKEGQLIFVEKEQKIYLDFGNTRQCYASGGISERTMNYIGISTDNPTKGKAKVDGKTIDEPKPNDMVVYGKKEYLWRLGEDGITYGWYEIGDEEAPEWN